ncbi:MAG: hypothetical protein E3K37_03290 [Candidatus Kuenenia sp.]|nr:hypothetical protein [Candidatus Kuenenia hertensis]
MGYRRYAWVGNMISEEDMASLYKLKPITKKPITKMVAEAVGLYVSKLTMGDNREKGMKSEIF